MKKSTKRKICVAVGLIALLFACGVVGGMERFYISVGKGIALAVIGLLVSSFAFYKSGYFKGWFGE